MHDTRNDDAVDVGKNFLDRRGRLRRRDIQLRKNCPRFRVRRNPSLADFFSIIRSPIGELMKLFNSSRRPMEGATLRAAKRLQLGAINDHNFA